MDISVANFLENPAKSWNVKEMMNLSSKKVYMKVAEIPEANMVIKKIFPSRAPDELPEDQCWNGNKEMNAK